MSTCDSHIERGIETSNDTNVGRVITRALLVPNFVTPEDISSLKREYEKSLGDDFRKVTVLVENLYDALEIYGYSAGTDEKSLAKHELAYNKLIFLYASYVGRHGENSWVKMFKWVISAFFSHCHKQDPVPAPNDDEFFKFSPFRIYFGKAQRFLKGKANNKKWLYSFSQTILVGSKKASPAVSDLMINNQVKDTFELLTTVPERPWKRVDWEGKEVSCFSLVTYPLEGKVDDHLFYKKDDLGYSTFDDMANELRRTTREIFRGFEIPVEKFTKPIFPSTSACFGSKVDEGGSVPLVKNLIPYTRNLIVDYIEFRTAKMIYFYFNRVLGKDVYGVLNGFLEEIFLLDKMSYAHFVRNGWDELQANVLTLCRKFDADLDYGIPVEERSLFKSIEDLSTEYEKRATNVDLHTGYFKLKFGRFTGYFSDEFGQKMLDDDEADASYEKEGFYLEFDKSLIEFGYRILYWIMFDRCTDLEMSAEIVGLPEPLKVRCITKGPGLLYHILRPLQKVLWKRLKDHPTFKLVGTPLTNSIISETFGWNTDDFLLSGDYKASTDNIRSQATEIVCNCLFDECLKIIGNDPFYDFIVLEYKREGVDFKELLKQYCLKSLTGHVVVGKFDGLIEIADQEHGQLMGSITSFIFLCIINAACCRHAMELDRGIIIKGDDWERKGVKLRDLPLLINGDDCSLSGSKNLKGIWESVISLVGLSSSIGKTYFSNEFVVMNSMLFERGQGCIWNEVKFVNLGLVRGQKKTNFNKGDRPRGIFSSIQKQLLDNCPEKYRFQANRKFLERCKGVFSRDIPAIPWYLPQWCGGLGLRKIEEDGNFGSCSYLDLRQVSNFINRGINIPARPEYRVWQSEQIYKKIIKDTEYLGFVANTYFNYVDGVELEGKCKSYINMAALFSHTADDLMKIYSYDRYLRDEDNHFNSLNQLWLGQRNRPDYGSLKVENDLWIEPHHSKFAVV